MSGAAPTAAGRCCGPASVPPPPPCSARPWPPVSGPSEHRRARPRGPGALPYPALPVGQVTGAFPFDHLVLVMQENHSFDNYLGMLPVSGQPLADGFTFNKRGEPVNWNPIGTERMYVYHQPGDIGAQDSGSQSWDDSHLQIDGGAMDGFAGTGPGSMGYYTEDDLPFYYSLANTFTLANRWFCSVPAQTYPNRRFYMAGTASGIVSTDIDNIDVYPPNGTIWDQLSGNGISWKNYFSDAPTTAIILDTIFRYPANLTSIAEFFVRRRRRDAAVGQPRRLQHGRGAGRGPERRRRAAPAGTDVRRHARPRHRDDVPVRGEPRGRPAGRAVRGRRGQRRDGGTGVAAHALVWLYDEHGGYYDHVAPPAAIPPDATPPDIGPADQPGGYNMYGPRVPVVVVSPYARSHAVTNKVHDHTSVLATIERQWNLPALTYRDANAATLADFLDTSLMTFAEPPDLAAPANPLPGLIQGYQGQPVPPVPTATKPGR